MSRAGSRLIGAAKEALAIARDNADRPARRSAMATSRKTLAEIKASPPRPTPKQRARLDSMSDDQIERSAVEDADNPPSTDEELDRGAFARDVRLTRQKLGMTQGEFAERFHINLSRLRDWEQGRFQPDSVAWAYLTVIAREPKAVARALEVA